MFHAEFLKNIFGDHVIRYEFHGIKDVLLSDIIPCPTNHFTFDPKIAVVASPDEIRGLFSLGNVLDDITFFSAGGDDLLVPDGINCNLIVTDLDAQAICQRLDSVMRQYMTWKIRILQALLVTNAPSSVITECSAISGVPFILLSSRYTLVCGGNSEPEYQDAICTELRQNGRLSDSGLSLVSNSDRYVLYGFHLSGGKLHYLAAPRSGDAGVDVRTLIMLAADILTKAQFDKGASSPEKDSFQTLIHDVLTEHVTDDTEILHRMSMIAGRRLNGSWFRCFVIRPDALDKTAGLLQTVKRKFPNCFSAEFNGDIVLLEIFCSFPPSRNHLTEQIAEAAKRYSFRACWHGSFFNLSALRITYLLTDDALRLDSLLKISSEPAFEYETYSIYNALAMMTEQYQDQYSGQDMVYMLHPHVFTLLLYDRSHGSSFGLTLNAYLNCNLSMDDTAKSLYVHRNTVAYRLKKIRSMLNINFDDGNLIFMLRFSFLLKDYLERYKGLDLAKNYTTQQLQEDSRKMSAE